jgi:hypothetical protein
MKKALVLAFALVLGLGAFAFAGPLSGSWDSSITLDIASGGTITVSDFSSTLVVDYTVGGWTFESTTGFNLTGWNKQEFTADGTLGAFTISSDLEFDPAAASFTSWDTTGSVSIAGVDLSGEYLLKNYGSGTPGSGWTFGASGVAGDLTLSATAYFNMDSDGELIQTESNCFCFSSVEFDASFPFACIDLVDVTIGFSTAGFDGVTFSVSGVEVPGIAWLTFDFDLTFDDGDEGKSLSVSPAISLGDWACIELYYDLITSNHINIDGIYFYGMTLSYTWNGVTFSETSAFDTSDPKDIVKDPYWEVFTIESAGDSCCGGAVDFTLDTYFDASSTQLFDWGETDASLSFGIGSNFTLDLGLVVKDTGLTQVSFGFDVTW